MNQDVHAPKATVVAVAEVTETVEVVVAVVAAVVTVARAAAASPRWGSGTPRGSEHRYSTTPVILHGRCILQPMQRIVQLIILLLLLIAPFIVKGQGKYIGAPDDTRMHAEQIVELVSKGDYEGAFSIVRLFWHFPASEINELQRQTETQLPLIAERYGAVIDHEFVGSKHAGQSILRHVFIIRYERHLLRFRITYYRGKKGWTVNSVKWDDDVDGVLDEVGKDPKTSGLSFPMVPGMGGGGP